MPKRHRQLRMKDLPNVPIRGGYRAGFKPATLRPESTNAPPRPIRICLILLNLSKCLKRVVKAKDVYIWHRAVHWCINNTLSRPYYSAVNKRQCIPDCKSSNIDGAKQNRRVWRATIDERLTRATASPGPCRRNHRGIRTCTCTCPWEDRGSTYTSKVPRRAFKQLIAAVGHYSLHGEKNICQ